MSHAKSSMKIGVDGVLIGAWGASQGSMGLDVGCGCGLIALMAAQRNPEAKIYAVDIHQPSVEEATVNFKNSPWANRLYACLSDISDYVSLSENRNKFDFIISNPPFFCAGKNELSTPREIARHQGVLSPSKLIDWSDEILTNNGTLSMIIPYDNCKSILQNSVIPLEKICVVSDHPGKKPKRAMLQFRKSKTVNIVYDELNIRDSNGEYSREYVSLTKDFYIGF